MIFIYNIYVKKNQETHNKIDLSFEEENEAMNILNSSLYLKK
jgi:hypothetical protein